MKRNGLCILALALAVAVCSVPIPASAQAGPTFKLGFKALADLVPNVVGQPLENEHWAANGDSLQRTTNGLMVWRKADNWTAFTNGHTTWINGPQGLQSRLNTERFPWEPDYVGPQPPPAPSAPALTGSITSTGKIERSTLQWYDLPGAYRLVRSGWTNLESETWPSYKDHQAVYDAESGGPDYTGLRAPMRVRAMLTIAPSEEFAARLVQDLKLKGMPGVAVDIPGASAAKLTEFTEPSGEFTMVVSAVSLSIANVYVHVDVQGERSVTTSSQAISLARRILERLVTDRVPTGPAFELYPLRLPR